MNAEDDNGAELIREQAATWIARLEGGERSAEAQAEFEAWLSADTRHVLVYRRMAKRFEGAQLLRDSRAFARASKRPSRRLYPAIAGGAIAAAIALIVVLPLYHAGSPDIPMSPRQATAKNDKAAQNFRQRIAAPAGVIRSVGLVDGSTVTLDGGSVLALDFTPEARNLRLLRGRARFSVAHVPRPFIVYAGGGSVVARGTVFDVAIGTSGRVDVALLRGAIDVTPALASASSHSAKPSRLSAGQTIAFDGAGLAPSPSPASADSHWADRVGEFDDVTLAYLLDRANVYATKPIRVAEPDIGRLKVSGRFRVTDPERLTKNLASLFGLRVEIGPDSTLLSRE